MSITIIPDCKCNPVVADLLAALKIALEDFEDTIVLVEQGLAKRENILRSLAIKAKATRAAIARAEGASQ